MEIRQAISMYLTAKAYNEPDFREKYENSKKSLDECVLYIQAKMLEKVTEEQKKGGAAVVIPSDDEIFALAVQYYLDEDIRIDGTVFNNVKLLSLSATTFTDEEKAQMRQEAIKKYQDGVIAEARKKDAERKAKTKKPVAPVLVPDVPALNVEPIKSENKTEAKQLSLF